MNYNTKMIKNQNHSRHSENKMLNQVQHDDGSHLDLDSRHSVLDTESKTPRIRFKGFSGEWEEKELHQIVNLCSGKDYKHLSVGNIPVYGTGGYMLNVSEALSYNEDAIGIGRKGTIDKPFVLKAPFWTVDTLFYAIPRKENDLPFIYSVFQKIKWKQRDESTGVPSLSKVTINSIQVFTSKLDEQTKIGNYFQNLDTLIEQKEKKYQKLRQFKKAMLDKMFPKNGAATPEIRFKGFSGEWEEKRLGDVLDYIQPTKYLVENTEYDDRYETPVLTAGKTFILGYTNETTGIFNENLPVIIFDDFTTATKFVNFSFKAKSSAMKILIAKEGSNIKFLFEIMQIMKYEVGGHERHWISKFSNFIILLPNLIEQTKIGNYFQKLDKLIDLHSQELEKLRNIKKASLEKMFV